jgi:general secretion pathway protein G
MKTKLPTFHPMPGLLKFEIRNLKSRSAFTLLEIMLVVVIIGMLLTVAVVKIQGRAEQARETAARADIESAFRTALNLYELDNGTYPTTEQGLIALYQKPSSEPVPKKWRQYIDGKKLNEDPWHRGYIYRYPGVHNPDSYDLSSLGKDGVESDDDIKNW